jgi:hypothetical protein
MHYVNLKGNHMFYLYWRGLPCEHPCHILLFIPRISSEIQGSPQSSILWVCNSQFTSRKNICSIEIKILRQPVQNWILSHSHKLTWLLHKAVTVSCQLPHEKQWGIAQNPCCADAVYAGTWGRTVWGAAFNKGWAIPVETLLILTLKTLALLLTL